MEKNVGLKFRCTRGWQKKEERRKEGGPEEGIFPEPHREVRQTYPEKFNSKVTVCQSGLAKKEKGGGPKEGKGGQDLKGA